MVAPEREPLTGEIEADEFFLGGVEEGLESGRQRGRKTLVGMAIERFAAVARGACACRSSQTPRATRSAPS
jgi:hypothetical protein